MNSSAVAPRSPLIQPFYPALDGLRAIAFLAVFLTHYGVMVWSATFLKWGWVGVDLFFVLSGFLITGILYDSLHRADFFRNFYVRRALRIFPLFYGFWIVLLLLTPVMQFVWNRYNVSMMLYLGNFFMPGGNLGHHASVALVNFQSTRHPGELRALNVGPLWSLCVEEQFYIAWPAVIFLIRKRSTLLKLCLALFIVVPVARGLYLHAFPQMLASVVLYTSTWSRIDTLLFGAALALWLRGPSPSPSFLRRAAYVALLGAPVALGFLMIAFHRYDPDLRVNQVISTIGFTLIAIAASGLLLLALDPTTRIHTWLRQRHLSALGRISYGMYFFHGIFSVYLYGKIPVFARYHLTFLIPVLAFAGTLVLATFSFRFLESPFLRLKSRLAARPGAVADPEPAPPVLLPDYSLPARSLLR